MLGMGGWGPHSKAKMLFGACEDIIHILSKAHISQHYATTVERSVQTGEDTAV